MLGMIEKRFGENSWVFVRWHNLQFGDIIRIYTKDGILLSTKEGTQTFRVIQHHEDQYAVPYPTVYRGDWLQFSPGNEVWIVESAGFSEIVLVAAAASSSERLVISRDSLEELMGKKLAQIVPPLPSYVTCLKNDVNLQRVILYYTERFLGICADAAENLPSDKIGGLCA